MNKKYMVLIIVIISVALYATERQTTAKKLAQLKQQYSQLMQDPQHNEQRIRTLLAQTQTMRGGKQWSRDSLQELEEQLEESEYIHDESSCATCASQPLTRESSEYTQKEVSRLDAGPFTTPSERLELEDIRQRQIFNR